MRIVDVNEFYSPTGGGVRTYVDRKMGILAAQGHELIVVAPGRDDRVDERPGGGRIIYIKAPAMPFDANYGLFWDAAPINRILDALDPDVIENCSPWRSAWIVGARRGRALKSFFMHNDNMEAYPKRWLAGVASTGAIECGFAWYDRYMAGALAPFDTVLTNGPALTRRLVARGMRIDATMTLGIERASFSPDHRDARLRAAMLAQCGLPPDAHLLVALGRHHPEKRWPVVIDAVERAGARLPVGLVLMGKGMGSRQLARRVASSPHIRLFQPVYDRPQLARILASADAFIHGNEAEPFGLVVSEALASGTPLIVPDVGGAFEVAAPAYAETYRARDARSAAEAIARLFARDQPLLRRAAAVAAATVRSDEDHATALVDHYRTLIEAKRALAA
jgi:alpha-1,6-mannosyltransferase